MGFFSWITQDTGESIANTYSSRRTFSVTMTDDKGNRWVEKDYDGYGVFDGKDFYELLDEMNGGAGCRDAGITLSFSSKPHKSPLALSVRCLLRRRFSEGLPKPRIFLLIKNCYATNQIRTIRHDRVDD